MRHTNLCFIVIAASILLAACAATSPSSQMEQQSYAVIKGYQVSFLKNVLVPIGTKTNVKIQEVDGEKKWNAWSGFASEVKLTQGPHSLVLLCYGEFDSIPFQYEIRLNLDVRSGKTYQLQPQVDRVGCKVDVQELKGKEQG